MTLFRSGWHADDYFGDDVVAHHMNTRSVYRFKQDTNYSITHSAPYVNNISVDQFALTHTEVTAYHSNGNVLSSVTKTLGVYDTWLDAYYHAIDLILQANKTITAPVS